MWRIDSLHEDKTNIEEWWNLNEKHKNDDLENDYVFQGVVEHVPLPSEDWSY